MSPTLEIGDRIMVNKFIYQLRSPARNDVIVFHAPENAREGNGDEFLVKRVIGLPGETIQVFNGQVWINDHALSEDYLPPSDMINAPPTTIPQGSVFVMGDNRDDSSDSREWGPVDFKLIVGRANLIVSPRSRFGYIR
jgi:signal peptidase I